MVPGLAHVRYEQKLEVMNLTTWKTRRLRADLIEMYKICHGLDNIDPNDLFVFS